MTTFDVHTDKAIKELRTRLDQAERERDEARAEQRDAEASRDLLVAGYTRAIREWLATHPGDSVPDVVDLFRAVMAERDEAGRAFRDIVAVLDRDGGQRQAGETVAATRERAVQLAADLVVGEAARIAAAEMARDVAWVRAVHERAIPATQRAALCCIALDVTAEGAAVIVNAANALSAADMSRDADADIAAAIRAARGENR